MLSFGLEIEQLLKIIGERFDIEDIREHLGDSYGGCSINRDSRIRYHLRKNGFKPDKYYIYSKTTLIK